MGDSQFAFGPIHIKNLKKNLLTLKLFASKGFFDLRNMQNRSKIFWKRLKASFTSKMCCKGDTVKGEVMVNLHGDHPMLWDCITLLWCKKTHRSTIKVSNEPPIL